MRCFTGVDLPESLKESISKFQARMLKENIALVQKEALHITLHFFENITEQQKRSVIEAIGSANAGPFNVNIKGISYFGEDEIRIVFAQVDDPEGKLALLYDEIGSNLSNTGVSYDKKEHFIPHITIARCRGSNPWLKGLIEEETEHEFGSFKIGKIFLKESTLSSKGPVHTTLFEHEI